MLRYSKTILKQTRYDQERLGGDRNSEDVSQIIVVDY